MNKKNSEAKERSTEEVCHFIQHHVLDFSRGTSTSVSTNVVPLAFNDQLKRWTRPPTDYVKVNFDAAFLKETGEGGWEFIVRDDSCDFIAAAAGRLTPVKDALQAETEACCRHSGNQGTTGRPARAHYIVSKISLRTRLSKPGEAPEPGEVSTGIPLEWESRQGLGEALSPQASSVSPTERTWALRPLQSLRRAKAR